MRNALVVGAGLTGAVAARTLHDAGWQVHVSESEETWGGQLRSAYFGQGLRQEVKGAHIWHSDSAEANAVMREHVRLLPYRHQVSTATEVGLLSWPPQVPELRRLALWPTIERELDLLPDEKRTDNFETYAIDVMGPTLYELLIRGYTMKQWGCDPSQLAASFAPKRIDLRTDGYLGLFRENTQGWASGGWQTFVDSLLLPIEVQLCDARTVNNVDFGAYDAVVVTAPLDQFLEADELPWRGVSFKHTYLPDVGYALAAPVVNEPQIRVSYTRSIETKQMQGAAVASGCGTVISREYPGAPARHYPIDDVEGENRSRARELERLLVTTFPNVVVAGRLGKYVYIDMDGAVLQGLHAAQKILKDN